MFSAILLDLMVLTIIGLSVYFAAKRGFARTFIETFGFILVAIISFTVCSPLATITYDKIIEPPVLKAVSNEVNSVFVEKMDESSDFEFDAGKIENYKDEINDSIDGVVESLPAFVQEYIDQLGIYPEDFLDDAEDIVDSDDTIKRATEKLTSDISQNQVKPIAVSVLSFIYSFVMFAVLMILVKIVAKLLNKAISFTIADKLNIALGGACGFAKGIAWSLLLCMIIYSGVFLFAGQFLIFSFDSIDATIIFRFLLSLIGI